MPGSRLLRGVAVVAAAYSLWAIWGAGRGPALWGLAFLLSALPIYALMRWRERSAGIALAAG
jgi:APA family basic amino acid/polyamine antiporter